MVVRVRLYLKEKLLGIVGGGISINTFKNSSLLIVSSIFSQFINFLCYPLITRSVDPTAFGKYALLLSFASIFTVLSFGRLELLFPKYKSIQERLDLLWACLILFLIVFLFLLLGLSFSDLLFQFARLEYLKNWSLMIILTFGSMSLLSLMTNYQIGIGSFKLLSLLRLLQPLVTIASTLFLLKYFDGYVALFWGLNISNVFCIVVGSIDLIFLKKELVGSFSLDRIFDIYRQNKKMITINSPHALIDSVQTNLLNVVMGRYYTVAAVGNYSLANRLVRSPMSIVSGAISQVFYKDIYGFDHTQTKELRQYTRKVLLILLLLSVFVMLFLFVFLKLFFVKIFGANWAEVVPIVFALSPWVIANFVASPLSQITLYKNRQGGAILFGMVYNGITLLSLSVFGILKYSLIQNILWTSCIGGLFNVIFILWILRILQDE